MEVIWNYIIFLLIFLTYCVTVECGETISNYTANMCNDNCNSTEYCYNDGQRNHGVCRPCEDTCRINNTLRNHSLHVIPQQCTLICLNLEAYRVLRYRIHPFEWKRRLWVGLVAGAVAVFLCIAWHFTCERLMKKYGSVQTEDKMKVLANVYPDGMTSPPEVNMSEVTKLDSGIEPEKVNGLDYGATTNSCV